MSTHNIGFYEDLTKIIFEFHQISSNTHFISSAVKTDLCSLINPYNATNSDTSLGPQR